MKIGILVTGHAPEEVQDTLGAYPAMFARMLEGYGFRFVHWNVVDGDFPSGPDAADGWLITGSRHGAYEDHPWIPPLENLIRDIHASARPLVGVCFGHQIIAQALGGRVEKFSGGWSIGRQVYRYKGRDLSVNAWHQDQVVTAPQGAEIIASSDFCANAGFVIGDRIITIQPHPEFDETMVKALLDHRAPGLVPEDRIAQAKQDLEQQTDRMDVAADIAAFFLKERPNG